MRRIIMSVLAGLAFVSLGACDIHGAHAADANQPPGAPANVEKWPTALVVTCNSVTIGFYVRDTPAGQQMYTGYLVAGNRVAADFGTISIEPNDMGSITTWGLFDGTWRNVTAKGGGSMVESDQLLISAVENTGLQSAPADFDECRSRLTQKLFGDAIQDVAPAAKAAVQGVEKTLQELEKRRHEQ